MAGKTNRRRRLNICNVIVWHVTYLCCVSPKERDAIYQRPSLAFSQKERSKHETQNIRIMTPNKADRRYSKEKIIKIGGWGWTSPAAETPD